MYNVKETVCTGMGIQPKDSRGYKTYIYVIQNCYMYNSVNIKECNSQWSL